MSKLLQLRGGTTTEHASFTGAVREVTVDTDKDTLVIHDGSTAGGFALPRTDAEIRTAVEAATDSNVFTDADHSKLNAIEASATADQTKADIEGLGIDVPAANLTGTVAAARLSTAATQAESDDSTKIATTAYVTDKITTLIGGAPSTLNDLNELAAAINDDANYNTTLTTALGTKMPIAGGTFTGDITRGGTVISDGAISDTGTFTLDVVGNIILDADNSGSIHLKDAGTQYGSFYKSGNNFVQYSPISDGDIIFQGLDGASTINALVLDMSEGGSATFNHDIKLADNGKLRLGAGSDLELYHDGSNSYISDVGTGNLVVAATNFYVNSAAGENYINCTADGAVNLYHNNILKLATNSGGIQVSGTINGGDLRGMAWKIGRDNNDHYSSWNNQA